MLDTASAMLTETLETPTDLAMKLLTHYSFDLGGCSASVLMERWLNDYPDRWIYLAAIEALYQGRYKALSVEQILAIWQRRGQAYFRFNHEFERLVCGDFSNVWRKLDRPTLECDRAITQKNPSAQRLDITKIELLTGQSSRLDKQLKLNNSPIEQFSPHLTDTNELYDKLKAIARIAPK